MIIKINDLESYTIEIPDTVSSQQFHELIGRFAQVGKLIGKDKMGQVLSSKMPSRKPNKIWLETKTQAVEVLNTYYTLPISDRQSYLDQFDINEKHFSAEIIKMKKIWNLKKSDMDPVLFEQTRAGATPKFNNETETESGEEKEKTAVN